MARRCTRPPSSAPDRPADLPFVVVDPDAAMLAVERSIPESFGRGALLLLVDGLLRLHAVIAIDGAPRHTLAWLTDLFAEPGSPHRLVVALVDERPGAAGRVTADEALDWLAASRRLGRAGVELVDVLLVDPWHWASMYCARGGRAAYPVHPDSPMD